MINEHGSNVIGALERAWTAIRARHDELPAMVIITGQGDQGTSIKWGHFAANAWTVNDGEADQDHHEMFIGGELLGKGGRRVLQTMLHEAAHGLAHIRGIKDTSNKARYHNKRFAALATEMGLQPPAKPHPVIGFSQCEITDATAESYAEVIRGIDEARLPHRPTFLDRLIKIAGQRNGNEGQGDEPDSGGDDPDGDDPAGPEDGKTRDGVRVAVACSCAPPRRLQVTPACLDKGDIICGCCDEPFVRAEPVRRRSRAAVGREL